MNNQPAEIVAILQNQKEQLVSLVSSLTEEQLNIVPFEGSWTAAQVAEHIRLSAAGLLKMLNGNVKPTRRAPDEYIEKIRAQFLDFNIKFNSPDFIKPPHKLYNKQELLTSLQEVIATIVDVANKTDLSLTRTGFPAAIIGELTGWEVLTFIITHTERHLYQMRNISTALTATDELPVHIPGRE